ncbi:MAG: hypothetical protein M0R47_01370 [Methylobacter sp.]|uniref:hypothetical protein n=1 Tax=Methylobacter sp. TaxID=2051955 RepID=UPI0025ED98E4|nr:hypothetical protein [Methylobacter sp.]MCK9619165.1 hypothetical protein [Methylobacter sp.]
MIEKATGSLGNGMVFLPPKSSSNKKVSDRVFRTALRPDLYLKLELEAQERGGLTPYKLTQILLTMYIEGKLKVVEDLHADSDLADQQ